MNYFNVLITIMRFFSTEYTIWRDISQYKVYRSRSALFSSINKFETIHIYLVKGT